MARCGVITKKFLYLQTTKRYGQENSIITFFREFFTQFTVLTKYASYVRRKKSQILEFFGRVFGK